MKFTRIIFALLLAALTARAQTNVIKISQLPTVGSLGGSERFVLLQGGTNSTATTVQIQAAPQAYAATASNYLATNAVAISNYLAGLLASEATARVAVSKFSLFASNFLALQIGNNATALTVASNALNVSLAAEQSNRAAASNALNSYVYNVAGVVTNDRASIVTVSNLAAAALQPGGAGSFSSLTLGAQATNNPATIIVDFSQGAFFYATNYAAAVTRSIVLTNFSAGKSAALFVAAPNGIASDRFNYPTGVRNMIVAGNPIVISSSSTSLGHYFLFSAFGTNNADVVMTGGSQVY